MNDVTSLLIVGVGGQGTILAGKVIASWALEQGFMVKMSEVHGMAQRGGSVVTQVRIGPQIYSPLVERGAADYILATEKLEAWRWLPYLKKKGTIIASEQVIPPLSVLMGAKQYPSRITEKMQQLEEARTLLVDALGTAVELGEPRAANTVLMGVFARAMGAKREPWHKALTQNLPARYQEVNIEAFDKGFDYSFA